MRTTGTRACTFSTFDKNIFPKQIPIHDLTAAGRYQEFQLTDKNGHIVSAINIHGEYSKQAYTSTLVVNALQNGAIVGGDLNITNGTKESRDIETALQSNLVAKGGIEPARKFQTIDVAISTVTLQPNIALGMGASLGNVTTTPPFSSAAMPSLPVLESIRARANPNLSDFIFMTSQEAQQFTLLLSEAGINGLNGKPLTVQADGKTVIVHNDNLDIARALTTQAPANAASASSNRHATSASSSVSSSTSNSAKKTSGQNIKSAFKAYQIALPVSLLNRLTKKINHLKIDAEEMKGHADLLNQYVDYYKTREQGSNFNLWGFGKEAKLNAVTCRILQIITNNAFTLDPTEKTEVEKALNEGKLGAIEPAQNAMKGCGPC